MDITKKYVNLLKFSVKPENHIAFFLYLYTHTYLFWKTIWRYIHTYMCMNICVCIFIDKYAHTYIIRNYIDIGIDTYT